MPRLLKRGTVTLVGRVERFLPKGTLILGPDFDAELTCDCYEITTHRGTRTYVACDRLEAAKEREAKNG